MQRLPETHQDNNAETIVLGYSKPLDHNPSKHIRHRQSKTKMCPVDFLTAIIALQMLKRVYQLA